VTTNNSPDPRATTPVAGKIIWLIPSVAALIFFALFVNLGRWQLERAHEKDTLVASFEHQDPAAAEHGPVSSESAEQKLYQYRLVYGHYDSSHQFLLDNMVHKGQVGFQVLTPLILPDQGQALLVNRGWVPLEGTRQNLPSVAVDTNPRQLTGRINRLPKAGFRVGPGVSEDTQDWPRLVQYPTASELEEVLDYPLFGYVLMLEENEPDGFVREWIPTVMSADQHRGYAVQWFAMAAVILILFTALSWKYWTRRQQE
jgi:surfeit locus 1 family protein